jgi:hypothetical protein
MANIKSRSIVVFVSWRPAHSVVVCHLRRPYNCVFEQINECLSELNPRTHS